jgi:glycine/D-amino acid oxidase-like deaminating enzyme
MSSLPSHVRAVVIGCGIVGNSVAYHLTDQGWSDVVLLDKGPLPNPGGSTGHASNFIFPVDHSKEMTQLTLERHRGRAHGGADAGADSPVRLGESLGHRAGVIRDAC